MKPHLWKASGVWCCWLPARPHRWCMGDTPQDAYAALMCRCGRTQ